MEKDYRKIFKEAMNLEIKYSNLSDLTLNESICVNIVSIGDSFSQQGNYGYQNHLASLYDFKVINIDDDKIEIDNPIQLLSSLINGDTFDRLKPDFIILENVERTFAYNGNNIDKNKLLTIKMLQKLKGRKKGENPSSAPGLFKDMTYFFIFNILYNFDVRAYFSQCCKMHLTKKLFSTKDNNLLFFDEDVTSIVRNTESSIDVLNKQLNDISARLMARGIALIVLPSPDKYDIYSSFIVNNCFSENPFFDDMRKERKTYIYIDSKELLTKHVERGEKDIYFADDTHWSPIATKIIAEEVNKKILDCGKQAKRNLSSTPNNTVNN